MSLTKRTAVAGIWAIIQQISRQTLSTIVFFILARFYLEKSDFGLAAMSMATISLLTVLVRQGIATTIIQRQTLTEAHLNAAFWANVCAGFVVTLTAFIFAEEIATLLGEQRLTSIIRAMSLILFLTSLGLNHEALLNRDLDFKRVAQRTLLAAAVSGVVGIVFASQGAGVWALVAMHISWAIVILVVLWSTCKWRPAICFSKSALCELLPTTMATTGIALSTAVSDSAVHLILGRHLGAEALGIFVVGQKLVALVVSIFLIAPGSVILPSFSRLNGDLVKARWALLTALGVTTTLTFPAFFGLAALADVVVGLIFGSRWQDAVSVVVILCAWGLVVSVSHFLGPTLQALGHSTMVLRGTLVATVILLVTCVLLGRYGETEFASGLVLSAVLALFWWWRSIKHVLGLTGSALSNAISRNFLAALLMYIIIIQLKTNVFTAGDVWSIFSLIIIGLLCYSTILWYLSNANAKSALALINQAFRRG